LVKPRYVWQFRLSVASSTETPTKRRLSVYLDRSRLDDSIDDLVKFSLMKRKSSPNEDGRALWMHPLVQVMARESCHDGNSVVHGQNSERQQVLREEGAREALCLVGTAVEVESHLRKDLHWTFEKSITTHLGLCYEYISEYLSYSVKKGDVVDVRLALVVYKLGLLNYHWGRGDQAIQVLQTADGLYEMLPDQSSNVRADALHTKEQLLYMKLQQSNKNSSNLELVEEAQEILAKQVALLGEHHRHTLGTMDTIATAFRRVGGLDDALELQLRCLQGCIESLGPKDGDFSIITNNLSVIYCERGEFDEALEYLTMSLDGKLRLGNEKHLGTFITLSNIANIYRALCQYEKALEFHHRAQSGYEEMFGLANIRAIKQASKLRAVYTKLERFEDALKWAMHSFEGCTNLYGLVHAETLSAIYDVMRTFEWLERPHDAFRWAKDLVDGNRRFYGEKHEYTREAATWVEVYGTSSKEIASNEGVDSVSS